MSKVKKVLLYIGGSFLALIVLSVVVATYFPTEETPKKITEPKKVEKVVKPTPKVEKPKPVKKIVKPKPVVKKPARPEYTAEEVYQFALNYEVRPGQKFAQILAMAVIAMRGEGQSVKVIERKAQEYSIKGLWVVSCVVVVGGFERTEIRLEADLRKKPYTVRPLNQVARDLWGY